MRKRFIFLTLALALCFTASVFATTPNPGHDASSIGAGTFSAGNFTFQNSLSVNGSLLYVNSTSGNVGVNTSAPSAALHIKSSIPTGSLRVDNAAGSPQFFINGSTGSVGIGTATPSVALNVKTVGVTDLRLDYGAGVYGRLMFGDDSLILGYGPTGGDPSALLVASGGDITFQAGNTDALFINASTRNIGIGTLTPNQKLHVIGSANITNTLYANALIVNASICLNGDCRSAWPAAGGNGNITGNFSTGYIPLATNGTNLNNSNIQELSTGEIGIGAAPSPGNELRLKASGTDNVDVIIESGGGSQAQLNVVNGGGLYLTAPTGQPVTLTGVDSTVAVGSGAPLTVSHNGAGNQLLYLNEVGSGDAAIYFGTAAHFYILGVDNSDGNKFKLSNHNALGGADIITVTNTSLVGINTSSPGYALDVAGTVATSQLCLNGDCKTAWPNGITGSGTTNYVPRWTSSGTIGAGTIYDAGAGQVGIGTTSPQASLHVRATTGSLLGTTSLGSQGWFRVFGSHAYATANSNFIIMDLKDPTNPHVLGNVSITTPGQFVIIGDTAYTPTYANNTIQAIDLSDPADPHVIGTYDTAGAYRPTTIASKGNTVYVTGNDGNMYMFSVNKGNITPVSSIAIGGAAAVDVAGNVLYTVGNNLTIWNITDSNNPRAIGSSSLVASAADIIAQGGYLYISDSSGYLDIFDVNNVTNPVNVSATAIQDNGYYMDVQGDTLFIGTFNATAPGQIYDVSNRASPTFLTSVSYGRITGGRLHGDYLYTISNTGAFGVFKLGGAKIDLLQSDSIDAGSIDVANQLVVDKETYLNGKVNVQGRAAFTQPILVSGDSSTPILIGDNGRIIINGTSATQALDVRGNANITGTTYTPQLCLNGDCKTAWPNINGISSAGGWTNTSTLVSLANSANNVSANALFVDNTYGDIGIRTATPIETLDVNGSARVGGSGIADTVKVASDTGKIGAANTTFTVEITSGPDTDPSLIFPPTGTLRIQNEAMTYTGIVSLNSTDMNFTGVTRGVYGTGAVAHGSPFAHAQVGKYSFFIYTNVTNDPLLAVDNFGRVGIDTASPNAALDVKGTARVNGTAQVIASTAGGGFELFNSAQAERGQFDVGADNNVTLLMYDSLGAQTVQINADGNRTTYFNAGNIGIGTTDPQQLLDVAKANVYMRADLVANANSFLELGRAGSTSYDGIRLQTLETTDWELGYDGAGGGSNAADFNIYNGDGHVPTVVVQNGTGNVGIGAGSPGTKLEVNGNIKAKGNGDVISTVDSTDDNAAYMLFRKNGTNRWSVGIDRNTSTFGAGRNDLFFYDNTASALRMVIQNTTGNVGIGTAAPSVKLDVEGGVDGTTQFALGGGSTDLLLTPRSTYYAISNSIANTGIGFELAGTPAMLINGTGSIGIGTTAPNNTLSVFTNVASDYASAFFNVGNNANRYGISVQAGADDGSGTTYYLTAKDGNGDVTGYVQSSAGTFQLVDVSDKKTKVNIKPKNFDSLNIINELSVVEYNRKQNPNGTKITGFVAQDVQNVYPEAVAVGPDGTLGLAKEAFIPVLVKAVQQQQTEIADQQSQIDALAQGRAPRGRGQAGNNTSNSTNTSVNVGSNVPSGLITQSGNDILIQLGTSNDVVMTLG